MNCVGCDNFFFYYLDVGTMLSDWNVFVSSLWDGRRLLFRLVGNGGIFVIKDL